MTKTNRFDQFNRGLLAVGMQGYSGDYSVISTSHDNSYRISFYRASICEGGLGSRNSVCPSVCLSVCHTRGL